jgi:hypothetical protein
MKTHPFFALPASHFTFSHRPTFTVSSTGATFTTLGRLRQVPVVGPAGKCSTAASGMMLRPLVVQVADRAAMAAARLVGVITKALPSPTRIRGPGLLGSNTYSCSASAAGAAVTLAVMGTGWMGAAEILVSTGEAGGVTDRPVTPESLETILPRVEGSLVAGFARTEQAESLQVDTHIVSAGELLLE